MKLPLEWILERAGVSVGAEDCARMLTMAGLEVEALEESESGPVLDIKVTPNRGDCLSVTGVARELAAACGATMPVLEPISSEDEPPDAAGYVGVDIEDPVLCPRYVARIITDVRSVASPGWMQRRLLAAGMRPLGGIVDVTNYVMLETGQPLHAFDYETIRQRRIVVRSSRAGEELVTLDGVRRALPADALVIADAERAVALAGIMGGETTEITAATTTILLESAHFDWRSVRRTARSLGLSTEASYRFERTVDPDGVLRAADRACELARDLGMGTAVSGNVDAHVRPVKPRMVDLRPERVGRMLGYVPAQCDVLDSLSRLGFVASERSEGVFRINIPSWRPDVEREIDLIEEVGRVLGYDRIPEKLPSGATTLGGDTPLSRFCEQVADVLVGAGLQEVVGHSLRSADAFDDVAAGQRVSIRSALSSDLSGLRTSLLAGLVEIADKNSRRNLAPLAFYEVGRVFSQAPDGEYLERVMVAGLVVGPLVDRHWARPESQTEAFYVARGLVDLLGSALGISMDVSPSADGRMHPGRQAAIRAGEATVGILGELHPRLMVDLRLRERASAFEIDVAALMAAHRAAPTVASPSPFPSVARDLAPRLDAGVPYAEVRRCVLDAAGPILESVTVTDLHTGQALGPGKKSITLALTFRALDRTLTDSEVGAVMDRIMQQLRTATGATFQTG